ncbi:MAG: tRNA (N6-isopentenyl adenosine(37)-C2)-methylthiotransferase MiaB [Clostridia bacterium]|nr:tRNA (N6-isopentenyl adenosine(37)-C2)-methylthiotransferase MiaB [Clostridia bacterium]
MTQIKAENDRFALENGFRRGAFVMTFGCQQNEADSEKIVGMAEAMGYEILSSPEKAYLIVVNTCAIREHAELKALSTIGQYKHIKQKNPELVIAVCGCMVTQEHRVNDIKFKYPYVDFVFSTSAIHKLPEILSEKIKKGKRLYCTDEEYSVAEGLPIKRESNYRAWVSIMYGCNNFCTYCIVPYVRGRERSRRKEEIIAEVCELVAGGYKDITLLGQNVNSYGKDMGFDYDFADLLEELAHIEGDFLLHFMTSHPKDATKKLVDVIANNDRVAKQFHLPLQSGSDSILKKMNRHYQLDRYMEIVDYMKVKIPDIVITTDIIVGFPGETEEDFEGTLDALRRVRYDMIYSFIYSPRMGTPAAEMENQIPAPVQSERFSRLLNLQNEIAYEINQKHLGETIRVLCDGPSKNNPNVLCGRTEGNKIVLFDGTTELTGQYVNIKINKCETFALIGEII